MQYISILFTPGSPLPLPLGVSQHVPFHLLILSYCFLCSSPLFFFVTQQVQLMLPAGTLSADVNLTLAGLEQVTLAPVSSWVAMSRRQHCTAPLSILWLFHSCLSLSRGVSWAVEGDDVLPRAEHSLSFILNTLPSCYIDCRRKLLWPRLKALISGYKHNEHLSVGISIISTYQWIWVQLI